MRAIPRLGLGTWNMGEDARRRPEEIVALKTGLDLGLTMIDTAEMYGSGRAEELVGEAIEGRRDAVFLVTKVLPQNSARDGVVRACERSLRRLKTDYADLYLLHWPGRHPIAGTIAGFEDLVRDGKIRHWGVSNFDWKHLEAMRAAPGGGGCVANQVYYNLRHRSAERRVMPWCREHGVVVQAYTPLDQGRLSDGEALRRVAARHDVTASAIALAWTMRLPGTSTIVKSGRASHVREFATALGVNLTERDVADLDDAYPPPERDMELETI